MLAPALFLFFHSVAAFAGGCHVVSVVGSGCSGTVQCPNGETTNASVEVCGAFDPNYCEDTNSAILGDIQNVVGVMCQYNSIYPCPAGDVTNKCHKATISISCCPTTFASSETNTNTATLTQTQTQTQTQSQSQTQTQTQIQQQSQTQTQSQSSTSTGTQTSIHNSTGTPTATQTHSESSTATQSESTNQENGLTEEVDLLQGGAAQTLTIAGIDCASAANAALQSEEAGAEGLGKCVAGLNTGEKMQALAEESAKRAHKAAPGAATADEGLLGSDANAATLAEFEKNFKMSGEDFVKKMVAGGANLSTLEEALRKRFSEEKTDALLAEARRLAAERGKSESLYELGKGRSTKPVKAVLRDSLKKSLVGEAPVRAASPSKADHHAASTKTGASPLGGLTPMENVFESPKAANDAEELTLFDVVHRKYQEKARLLHL